jgi:hypothetical protein
MAKQLTGMPHVLPTDIVQSFWLRFWREPHRGLSIHWRGTVWHEQQRPGESPAAVASPEEAFEFVRRALNSSLANDALNPAGFQSDGPGDVSSSGFLTGVSKWLQSSMSLWRRLRGRQS